MRYIFLAIGCPSGILGAVKQHVKLVPRQDGIVLTGLAKEFPLYHNSDIATKVEQYVSNKVAGDIRSYTDPIPIISSDEKNNNVVRMDNKPACWWTYTLSNYACVESDIFGWAFKDTKDQLQLPREEYRLPVALFSLSPSNSQKPCPYPYKDKRWTGITYCFDNRSDALRFQHLHRNSMAYNRYATLKDVDGPDESPYLAEKTEIVANVRGASPAILDDESVQNVYEKEVKGILDIYLRRNPVTKTLQYANDLLAQYQR